MDDFKFTEYFEKEVLRKRPYLKKEWCIEVVKIRSRWRLKNITDFGSGVLLKNLEAMY
jgi:hypothetical protein